MTDTNTYDFTKMAAEYFGIQPENVTPEQRAHVKHITFFLRWGTMRPLSEIIRAAGHGKVRVGRPCTEGRTENAQQD